jgi:hypothetical protein
MFLSFIIISETSFSVETKVIVADFSLGEDEYQRIFKLLDDLEIGILSMHSLTKNTFFQAYEELNIFFNLNSQQCRNCWRTTKQFRSDDS